MSGWPTPNAGPQNDTDSRWQQRREECKARHGNNGFGLTLGMASTLAGWPTSTSTASARDWKDTAGMATEAVNPDGSTRTRLDQLPRQAQMAGWPTTQASGGSGGGQAKRALNPARSNDLMDFAMLAANPQPARFTASGEMLTGCSAGMESGGQLNPDLSRWLMGYPAEWGSCGASAMRSIRTRRPSSSARSRKLPDIFG